MTIIFVFVTALQRDIADSQGIMLLVLTKYDQMPEGITIDAVVRNNPLIHVRGVPVFCTSEGCFNVDLPILDMLDSGLRLQYDNAVKNAQDCYKSAGNYRSKKMEGGMSIGNFFNHRRCRF